MPRNPTSEAAVKPLLAFFNIPEEANTRLSPPAFDRFVAKRKRSLETNIETRGRFYLLEMLKPYALDVAESVVTRRFRKVKPVETEEKATQLDRLNENALTTSAVQVAIRLMGPTPNDVQPVRNPLSPVFRAKTLALRMQRNHAVLPSDTKRTAVRSFAAAAGVALVALSAWAFFRPESTKSVTTAPPTEDVTVGSTPKYRPQ